MLAYRCSEFLDILHIPSVLSSTLAEKLAKGNVGVNGQFKVMESEGDHQRLVSCHELLPFDDIWVIPHTHRTNRSKLYKELKQNDSLRQSLIQAFKLPPHIGCDVLFEEYWCWCFSCSCGLENDFEAFEELEWNLEAPELLSIPHADAPNVIVRALPPVIFSTLYQDVFKHGASILCLVSAVSPGQMLKRDLLPKKRTRSRIARLLALIGDTPSRWAHESELAGLRQVNHCSSPLTAASFEVAKPISEKGDARPLAAMTEFTPTTQRVFSDYPSVHTYLTHPSFEKVAAFESSDILFAVSPVASFNSLGKRLVNQFPYESTLISPRRLLHAVRGAHHGQGDFSSSSVIIDAHIDPVELLPDWFPLSFDLKTEVKLFLEIQQQLPESWWILIGSDAGALDWCVSSQVKTIVKYMEANESNWVLQKLPQCPLLYEQGQVMMSMFLLVCSFEPMDTYLYKRSYATAGSSPYSLDAEFLADDTVQLPFEDPTQTVLTHEDLVRCLAAHGADWEEILEKIIEATKSLLMSVRRQIGPSQRSRALYRLDFRLMSVHDRSNIQPQLSRVSFAPDLVIPAESHREFVNQVFEILFLNGEFPDYFIPITDGLSDDSEATDVTTGSVSSYITQ